MVAYAEGDRAATPRLLPIEIFKSETLADGFNVEIPTSIGEKKYVYLHAWYDTNGNGKEDRGDAAGDLTPAPFHATDRGAFSCSSNKNVAPDIVTSPIP